MFSKVTKFRDHGVNAVVVTAATTIVPAPVSLTAYLSYFKFLYMVCMGNYYSKKYIIIIFSYSYSTLIDKVI